MIRPYTFRAECYSLWDGDSIRLWMDRGEGWSNKSKYRLYGVDTPEIRGKDVTAEEKRYGREAKEFVANLILRDQCDLVVSTEKGDGKFDYNVEIFLPVGEDEYISLSETIITHGHGVPYFGGRKQPWEVRKRIQDAARAQFPLD